MLDPSALLLDRHRSPGATARGGDSPGGVGSVADDRDPGEAVVRTTGEAEGVLSRRAATARRQKDIVAAQHLAPDAGGCGGRSHDGQGGPHDDQESQQLDRRLGHCLPSLLLQERLEPLRTGCRHPIDAAIQVVVGVADRAMAAWAANGVPNDLGSRARVSINAFIAEGIRRASGTCDKGNTQESADDEELPQRLPHLSLLSALRLFST
jgi:hypothetical protein